MTTLRIAAIFCVSCQLFAATDPKKDLERFILEAEGNSVATAPESAGSLFHASAPLATLGLDIRAGRVNDLVTILVQERASAISKGTVKTARSSNAKASVSALGGALSATSALTNLAQLGSNSSLDGEGATSRETVLSTVLTARVAHVLSNGNLVIEATKNVTVNAETQLVFVRGIIRPADLTGGNTILSDRIALMEVRVNGKGVVQDAIRRPFFLYRLLLGILPF
jgi:flagellar L-ring protein precursor FlgH